MSLIPNFIECTAAVYSARQSNEAEIKRLKVIYLTVLNSSCHFSCSSFTNHQFDNLQLLSNNLKSIKYIYMYMKKKIFFFFQFYQFLFFRPSSTPSLRTLNPWKVVTKILQKKMQDQSKYFYVLKTESDTVKL